MRQPAGSCALLLTLFATVALASAGSEELLTPITVWGPASVVARTGVDTKSVSAVQGLATFLGSSPDAATVPTDTLILLFVSRNKDAALSEGLESVLESAGGWAQLPNAHYAGGEGDLVVEALQPLAGQRSANVLGTCEGLTPGAPATTTELLRMLGPEAPRSGVVVVCAGDETDEAQLLEEAMRLSAADSVLTLLVQMPNNAELSVQRRRRLAQHGAPPSLGWNKYARREGTKNYTVCDPTCQRQVLYFEGIIVLVVVGLAVAVGLTCLHIIDTPTHLSAPKGGSTGHHHHE